LTLIFTVAGFIWIMRFFAEPLPFLGPFELCSSATEAEFPPSAPAPAPAADPAVFVLLVLAAAAAGEAA
jgi:hypothetical protein